MTAARRVAATTTMSCRSASPRRTSVRCGAAAMAVRPARASRHGPEGQALGGRGVRALRRHLLGDRGGRSASRAAGARGCTGRLAGCDAVALDAAIPRQRGIARNINSGCCGSRPSSARRASRRGGRTRRQPGHATTVCRPHSAQTRQRMTAGAPVLAVVCADVEAVLSSPAAAVLRTACGRAFKRSKKVTSCCRVGCSRTKSI